MRVVRLLAALVVTGCAHGRAQPTAQQMPPAESMQLEVLRLEEALRARDDTIRALRLELQKLKEIDLKPRRPAPEGASGTGVRGA